MPLEATPRKVGPLSGNGVTTDFSFEFKVFDETDLTVIRTSPNGGDVTLLQPSQYSVVLNPDQDADPGGIVRLTTPLLADYDLTILSSIPATQPLDWENQGRFSPAAMNDGLDRNTALIQQLLRDIGNTLRVPATVGPINVEKPVGGSILAWSTDAQSLISIDPQSLIGFAAYGEGVVDVFAGDGTETTFSLSLNPGAETNLTVSIGGVMQAPGADYNWTSGTALVFTEAPPAGVDIVVRYQRALPSEGGGGGGGGGGTGDVVGPISSVDGRIALFDGSTGKALRQASLAIGDVLSRSNHTGTQLAATISDLSEAVDDRVAALLVAGSGISLSYNDAAGALTISATGGGGGGSGDVVGPASSIDGRIALFDGTTGKLIRQGSLALGDLALASHSHSNATTGAAGFMSAADKSKLDGVAAGATANATDAALRARASHTGTQGVATITGLGNSATRNVGTTAGTVAAGDDARLTNTIYPEDYNAVGDGSTDDATALQAAINAAISQNKPLRLSRNYRCTSSLTASGGSLSVFGDGTQGSEIIFSANQGFVFNGGTPVEYDYAVLVMRDLGLRVTGGVSTASVLKVTATGGSGSTAIGFIGDNLDISGQSGLDGFACGIELQNARNLAITNCRILGDRDRGFAIQSARGIKITSDTAEGTEISLTNNDIYFVDEAIEITGTFEGGIIQGCTIVACYTGVNSSRVDGGGDPLIVVSNCHINTYRYGVRARNRFQSFVNGCLFYAFDTSTPGDYFGVDLISEVGPTLNWQIIGNTFKGDTASAKARKTGIRINGGATLPLAGGDKTSTIEANHFERMAQGITLGNYSSYVTVGPSNTRTDVDTWITDSGAANRIHYPLLRQSGFQSTIMFGSGAEDATNALVGVHLVPDANSTHLNGTDTNRWAHTYTDALTATGVVKGSQVLGETSSTGDGDIVLAANAGAGGNFQVRASGSNPIFMRVGGLLRRVQTTNIGGFDVLILV